jgi:hypothetical protein
LPLNQVQLPSTHNSHITYADNYGNIQGELAHLVQKVDPREFVHISNHWVTVTDQLNLGARHLELDIHYFLGSIRICHAGGVHLKSLNRIVERLSKLLNTTIHWDSETLGCFSTKYPTLIDALNEINDWMSKPENQNEIIFIYFDNQQDLDEWNFVKNITVAIDKSNLGSIAFTPDSKNQLFPFSWPSMKQLRQMNKRAIFVTGTDYKDHNAPYLFRKDIWEEVNNEDFIAYPSCNTKSTSSHMVSSKFFRILTEVIWLAWFETPSKPFLGEQVVPNMFKCAHVNFISVDLLTPTIAESFIWSWQKNEPTIKTPKNGCTIIDKTTGRWYIDTSCNTLHIHACKSINNEK